MKMMTRVALAALSWLSAASCSFAQTTPFPTYITGLPAASSAIGTEKMYALQGGTSKTLTPYQILGIVAGDCTIAAAPSIVCTKTNGVAFAALATTIPGTGVAAALGNAANSAGGFVTSPVPVANGGTGDTGTAWTAYTPTVTAASGTGMTYTATGAYKTIGKTVFWEAAVTITAAGTATGQLTVSLPFTQNRACAVTGRELVNTGVTLAADSVASTATVRLNKYDNTTIIATNASIVLSAVCETT